MEKRIYSLNLAAYVMATTEIIPKLVEDPDTKTYYCVFLECAATKTAVQQFKGGNPQVPIWDFLRAIKYLRQTISTLRGGESDAN